MVAYEIFGVMGYWLSLIWGHHGLTLVDFEWVNVALLCAIINVSFE